MIWTLIGTLMVGVTAACVMLIFFRVSRRTLPKWTLPAAAGFAMFSFHIWSDYTWIDRTTAELPSHVVVAERYRSKHPMQPWTYILPRQDRFAAVDLDKIRHNPSVDDMAFAVIYLVTRYYPTVETQQLFDCNEPRRADVGNDFTFDEQGRPVDPDWVTLEPDDPVRRVVCAQEKTSRNGAPTTSKTTPLIREHARWQTRASSSSTTSRVSGST